MVSADKVLVTTFWIFLLLQEIGLMGESHKSEILWWNWSNGQDHVMILLGFMELSVGIPKCLNGRSIDC